MLTDFILYTGERCSWCDKAKALITKLGFTYHELKVSEPFNRQQFDKKGYKTVPQIYVLDSPIGAPDDETDYAYIGTYMDLVKWFEDNQ